MSFDSARSLDGMLVALDTALYTIRDALRDDALSRAVVSQFLSLPSVAERLSRLACFRDQVLYAIEHDPRLKSLRKFADLIEASLARLSCVEERRPVELVSRPPTWALERKRVPVERPRRVRRIEEVTQRVEVRRELYASRPHRRWGRGVWAAVALCIAILVLVLAYWSGLLPVNTLVKKVNEYLGSIVARTPVVESRTVGHYLVIESRTLLVLGIYNSSESELFEMPVAEIVLDPGLAFSNASGTLTIYPVRAMINATFVRAWVPLEELRRVLASGSYDVVGWIGSRKVCEGELDIGSSIELDCYSGSKRVPSINCSTHYTILKALLCGINETVLQTLRTEVLGNVPRDVGALVYKILAWEESNLRYNRSKYLETRLVGAHEVVETPFQMLRTRSGVCVDYAVFTAALLLAAGLNEAYVVDIHEYNHAVAVLNASKTLIVLDQILPATTWSLYSRYTLCSAKPLEVTIYRVSMYRGAPQIEAWIENLSTITAIHPRIPEQVIEEAAMRVAKNLNLVLNIGARSRPRLIYNVCLETPQLDGVQCRPYPMGVLYTPMLKSMWITMIQHMIEQALRKIPDLQRYRTIWVTATQSTQCTTITMYLG